MKPIVIPAKREHVNKLARDIRKADADEMWALGGWRPYEGVLFSFENSTEAYTVVDEADPETPILMFGLGKNTDIFDRNTRSIWLLGTEQASKIRKEFVRQCASYMLTMASGFKVYNFVLANNHPSLRWLKWLGFTIMAPKPYGWLGKEFHYVERSVPCAYSQQPPPQA